ncbi:unnamed protein product, partial [Ectocarpus sp. 8 AP-2014]
LYITSLSRGFLIACCGCGSPVCGREITTTPRRRVGTSQGCCVHHQGLMAPRPTGRRTRSPARLRRRVVRRRGGGMIWGAVGLGGEKSSTAAVSPLLLLLLLAPKAAMAQDSGVTSEEEEE